MRLIRTVRRPANIGFFRQFQQCQVNKTSSTRRHPVIIEASNGVHGSSLLWRGRSYAASASSGAMEAKKPRRRISKNERRSMVENYVKNYRETNAGKFPTVSDAKRDVGGSYYFVRQILQELMYNSKQSSMVTKETLEKSATKKDETSTNSGEVLQTREQAEIVRPIFKEDIGNSNPKIFESKQEQQSSISVETDKLEDVGVHSDRLIDKTESGCFPGPENYIKQEALEDKLKFDGLEPKAGPQESTEMSRRGSRKGPTEDAEPLKQSSVWNNLKAFASGILSIWKRY